MAQRLRGAVARIHLGVDDGCALQVDVAVRDTAPAVSDSGPVIETNPSDQMPSSVGAPRRSSFRTSSPACRGQLRTAAAHLCKFAGNADESVQTTDSRVRDLQHVSTAQSSQSLVQARSGQTRGYPVLSTSVIAFMARYGRPATRSTRET